MEVSSQQSYFGKYMSSVGCTPSRSEAFVMISCSRKALEVSKCSEQQLVIRHSALKLSIPSCPCAAVLVGLIRSYSFPVVLRCCVKTVHQDSLYRIAREVAVALMAEDGESAGGRQGGAVARCLLRWLRHTS